MWIICQLQLGRFGDASITIQKDASENLRHRNTVEADCMKYSTMEWCFDLTRGEHGRSWLYVVSCQRNWWVCRLPQSCDRHEGRRKRCSCIRKTQQDTSKLRWKCRLRGRLLWLKMIVKWNGHVEKGNVKTEVIQNTQTYSEPISNLLKGVSNQAEEDNYIGVCLNCFFPVWCSILSPARNWRFESLRFQFRCGRLNSRTEDLFSENSRQS